jgi:hypothetical protein
MKAARVGAETMGMRRVALLTAFALALAAGSAEAYPLPGAPQCPVFPASSVWNKRVDRLPVAGNSSAIVGSIGAGPQRPCRLWLRSLERRTDRHPDHRRRLLDAKEGRPV